MTHDLLSREFRAFKRKSEAVMPAMTTDEAKRVKLALEYLVASFDRHLASRAARPGAAR